MRPGDKKLPQLQIGSGFYTVSTVLNDVILSRQCVCTYVRHQHAIMYYEQMAGPRSADFCTYMHVNKKVRASILIYIINVRGHGDRLGNI